MIIFPEDEPEHPEAIKLTDAQWKFLTKVCQTNGGGASYYDASPRVVKALAERGLIQGKSGQLWRIVHTRAGFVRYRAGRHGEPKK